MAIVEHNYNI